MTGQHSQKSICALTKPFQLDDWQVDPAADCISRDGEQVHLEPRVMTVLCLLAARAAEVVSRERLEAQAWAGMVVGYDALASSIIKLRKALGDDSRNPRYIETVSKKGYRLIAPVTADIQSGERNNSGNSFVSWKNHGRNIAIALALIVVAMGSFFVTAIDNDTASSFNENNDASKEIVAVLPFANISGDPKHEYFVDGITDDLITDLSGLSGIVVISRSAVYRYKGQNINPKEVGRELGAGYLLEGSVRKSGKRWRINVKLIDARNGTNLWAERYENKESSLFKAQDEVAHNIVEALSIQLSAQDKQRLGHRPTTNFEAYEQFLLGQKLFKVRSKESNQAAQDAYRQAIKLDPNFARAYGALSVSLNVDYWRGWTDTPAETLDRALAMARLATKLDPASPQAYWALGYALMYHKQLGKAAEAVEHAIALAPNYADGYGLLALINNHLGNGKEAARLITKGMRLNPHYSWDYPYNLGRAYYTMGKYEDAVEPLLLALNRNEYAVNPRIYLIASYMALGRKDDAAWEVEQIRVISPETTVTHLKKNYPNKNDTLQNTFLEHLRGAGLPE